MNASEQGLEPFLQYLNTFPNPSQVATAMLRGPLAAFGAQACDLWVPSGFAELVRLANDGHDDTQEMYQRVSLAFEAPLTESFINSYTIILHLSEVLEKYPSLTVDREYWEELSDSFGDGDLVQVPIFSGGQPIGVYSFLSNQINVWVPASYSRLSSVAAALALWMSHQGSGVMEFDTGGSSSGLWLTPRQAEILNLVRDGRTNGAISAHLGYSQSTVKQELLRITKRLQVNSRWAAVKKATDLNLLPPQANG